MDISYVDETQGKFKAFKLCLEISGRHYIIPSLESIKGFELYGEEMRKKFLILAVFAFQIAGSGVARAADTPPRLVGAYDAWEAYVFTEDGKKVCYMVSQPGNKEGDYTKRGDPFALVTHRPGDNTRDVFSYITGYTYKPGSEVVVTIDDKKFVLFTHDKTAWAPDAETDRKIAEAIKSGKSMRVVGTSNRDTLTTDTFSLKGSGKAYERITRECR